MPYNMTKTRLINQSINDEIKKVLIHQFLLYSAKTLNKTIEGNKKYLESKC